MAENLIDRSRVFVGDVYLDSSQERNARTRNYAKKVKEQVLLIAFGNYFVEFDSINGKQHFARLYAYANAKFDLSKESNIFLGFVANSDNPYFVKDVKHFFTINSKGENLSYSDLDSLSYYISPNVDCSY